MAGTFGSQTVPGTVSLAAGAGIVAFGGGASTLLAACGSSKKAHHRGHDRAAPAATGSLGAAKFQLSWIKDVEFAGEYIADTKGYYTQAGFSSVNLLAGGPSVNQDAVVASGQALVVHLVARHHRGRRSCRAPTSSRIGAQYQKNPFCIMSLATNPLPNPQDMIGKKIGVQSTNPSAWNVVPEGQQHPARASSPPCPCGSTRRRSTTGTVDGWFSFITNEPIQLKRRRATTPSPSCSTTTSTRWCRRSTSCRPRRWQSKRDALKAFLKAEIMGWHDSLKDPTEGRHAGRQRSTARTRASTPDEQSLAVRRPRTSSSSTTAPRPRASSPCPPDMIDGHRQTTLAIGGIDITADKLFDMSVLDEVYQENPDLKTIHGVTEAT